MKLFQIVFSFTSKTEALYEVVAETEAEAIEAVKNHPQIKDLPDLTILQAELIAEDNTPSSDLSKDRTIN
jgi:hypothetical protein